MHPFEQRSRQRRFPLLTETLARQLEAIPMSGGLYRPCSALLRNGAWVDSVYFAEAAPWYLQWGVWPDEDRGKRWIDVGDVVAVRESPNRLPPHLARVLYEAGESGMGYSVFILQFLDGSHAAYVTGNAVDFVDYPEGQSAATVTGVVPHEGREDPQLRNGPSYAWCLFSGPVER
jgi:hypothetical protein